MDSKGQAIISQVAIGTLAFLIIFAIFGQFLSVTTGTLQTNTNVFISSGFNAGLISLINLLPLVLIGAAIITIVIVAFRLNG